MPVVILVTKNSTILEDKRIELNRLRIYSDHAFIT